MDLIEYLTSYKKKIKTRKKIRKSRIPRRGRGFGQRVVNIIVQKVKILEII